MVSDVLGWICYLAVAVLLVLIGKVLYQVSGPLATVAYAVVATAFLIMLGIYARK